MTAEVAIRAYREENDAEPLRRLLDACYGANAVSEERWRHWHFGLEGAVPGTVVAEAEGRLVGVQPMEVCPHRLAGAPVTAGVLTGVMVEPAWRRRGVFTRLVGAAEERAWQEGAALVWTMPNELSRPGFHSMGYRDPGERRLLVWAPRPERVAGAKLPRPLAGLAGLLVSPIVARRPVVPLAGDVEETARLEGDASALADRVASAWPGLMQERSLGWLRWRFNGEAGSPRYRFFALRGPGGSLRAWAVTRREEREGLRVGYLVDVMAEDSPSLRAVGRAALDALADEGVELIMTVVSAATLRSGLREVGLGSVPVRLAPKRFYTVFRARPDLDPSTQLLLSGGGRWYMTLSDWDNL